MADGYLRDLFISYSRDDEHLVRFAGRLG